MAEETPPPPTRERLLSLDVMRGVTILAMILVNNPGDWGALYGPLGHADWHGWTATDLIFPFFLFMVGVAMAYSFAKYTTDGGSPSGAVWFRIVRRVFVLILLGLMLNGSGQLIGVPFGFRDEFDFSTLRWPGVLQRIALAYLGASVVVLLLNGRGQLGAAMVLMIGYALALHFLPWDVGPDERMTPESNVVRQVDVALIGEAHMWTQATTRPTDPEGLLSTAPSIVTALIGYAVGRWLRAAPLTVGRVDRLFGAGLLLAGAGLVWEAAPYPGWGMPINKALWTPSFVLLTGGLGTLALATCLYVFDLTGRTSPEDRRVPTAFQMVGVNAIFVFVASGFAARALTVFQIGDQTVKAWIYQNLLVTPLSAVGMADPRIASLGFAVGFVGCWWLVLWWMWRRGWSIRV